MKTELCTALLAVLMLAPCCGGAGGTGDVMNDEIRNDRLAFPEGITMETSFAGRFYQPVESAVQAEMEPAGLPIAREEVINLDQVLLASGIDGPPQSLLNNGFLVFAPLYGIDNPIRAFAMVESLGQPVYVSSGIPLHMLHIFFDQILQKLEEDHFYGDLADICGSLYRQNLERGCSLNAGFFAVPLSFLDSSFSPDPSIAEAVGMELELIAAHSGFNESPLMGYREDYSQYVPRGHYTASEKLENYFRAMMWLGRLTFILNGGEPAGPSDAFIVNEDDARYMTACALMTVSDLSELEAGGETLMEKWGRIYELTAFFAGFADDLSVPEYAEAALEVAGSTADVELVTGIDFYRRFRDHVNTTFPGPSIYSGTGGLVSMPDAAGEFDPGDLQTAFRKTTGFRFMGQRYTPDSEILGKLVFPSVGQDPSGNSRFMPTGLDVAAAFGSTAAMDILEERGDLLFDHYADSLHSMAGMIDSYGPDDWHATLYMSWLHCLYLLMQDRGEGYPDFMGTQAWDRHTLSTFLASWAMLRHDTILYAKQSYTMEAGCAPGPYEEPEPSAGFVEPVPDVYAQLNATLEMARRGLSDYGVLDGEIEGRFRNACSVMTRLQTIAEGELAGETMTQEDAAFLESFASYLESSICWGAETEEGLETSLIADVHTDQNSSSVLEVASGDLDFCIVIYRRPDGNVEAAVGPVLSYYEFTWPMSDRLTDEAWRNMLRTGRVDRPSWIRQEVLAP